MWPFGKSKKYLQETLDCYSEALKEANAKIRNLEAVEQRHKDAVGIAAIESEARKRDQAQADAYFALSVYPSGRDCWACGFDLVFTVGAVEIVTKTLLTDTYGGRRYLMVTCPRCTAKRHERFVTPTCTCEVEPEKEPVKSEVPDSDSKGKEGE